MQVLYSTGAYFCILLQVSVVTQCNGRNGFRRERVVLKVCKNEKTCFVSCGCSRFLRRPAGGGVAGLQSQSRGVCPENLRDALVRALLAAAYTLSRPGAADMLGRGPLLTWPREVLHREVHHRSCLLSPHSIHHTHLTHTHHTA